MWAFCVIQLEFISIKDIVIGEELLIDYNEEINMLNAENIKFG